MSVRDSFVKKFGEAEASKFEVAAESHKNGIHDKQGSDPFKWVILICIGSECFTNPRYRAYHGITADAEEVRQWCLQHGDLASHDGDCDFLALCANAYEPYLVLPTTEQENNNGD